MSERAHTRNTKTREEGRGEALADYWPLLSLTAIAAAAGGAISAHSGDGLQAWMHAFMGFFLCSFAMLKIFDLPGFADGFEMYDVIAKRWRGYAYLYPFIELGLGLAYLAFAQPIATYLVTVLVMGVGAVGVALALREGLDIECPCMGSVLAVPLSTVTLSEDLGMGLMAAAMKIVVRVGHAIGAGTARNVAGRVAAVVRLEDQQRVVAQLDRVRRASPSRGRGSRRCFAAWRP